MIKTLVRAFALLFLSLPLAGQDLDSLLKVSAFTAESDLQKALNQNLTISSGKALTTRETPGIISLITGEEIANSGARDLIDVLRMIPGFDIAQDLSFIIGIGLRGSWANEGKVLLMLDGQPFNDLLYQGVALGNHFPVDFIERIEVIRGPGSAMYGGSAEYGVINIITRAADKQNGIHVFGSGGFHRDAVGRTNGGVSVAKRSEAIDWDLALFSGNAVVSDGRYSDITGDTVNVDLGKHSYARPFNINGGLRIGDLKLRAMYDEFKTNEPYTKISFRNISIDARYDWKINDKLTLSPHLRYFNQIPWQYQELGGGALKVRAERMFGSLLGNYAVTRKLNLNFGLVYFQDRATDLLGEGYLLGKNKISFNNYALFFESLFKHRLANATLGVRYERNSEYGDAFVPRLALTKKIENLHFKVLYSQAFRAPSIENINLRATEEIKPETSNVFELELGYQFTPQMLLAVNAFSFNTRNVIVYESAEDAYYNFDKTGSSGLEVIYSIRRSKWYSQITYSFNRASSDNTIDTYAVPGRPHQFVGFSNHKLTVNTNLNVTDHLTVNPTIVYGGKRYAYTTAVTADEDNNGEPDVDEEGELIYNGVLDKLPGYTLLNLFVNYRELIKGLAVGAGVYDVFNEQPDIPQAYNGLNSPIPGRSREYVIKVSYQLDFNK